MNCVGGPANAADEVAKTIVVVARPARESRAQGGNVESAALSSFTGLRNVAAA